MDKKKRSLKQLEFTDCCHTRVSWSDMLYFPVLLLHSGSETMVLSMMVTNHPVLFPSCPVEPRRVELIPWGVVWEDGPGGPILNDQVVDIVRPWCEGTGLHVLLRLYVCGWAAEGLNSELSHRQPDLNNLNKCFLCSATAINHWTSRVRGAP